MQMISCLWDGAASCFIFIAHAVLAGAGRRIMPSPETFYSFCGTEAEIDLE